MIAAVAMVGVLLSGAACTRSDGGPAPTSPAPSASSPDGTGTLGTPPPPSAQPTGDIQDYALTYGSGVPTATVTVDNDSTSRAYLVGIYALDFHGDGDPPSQQLAFYFRGDLPSYHFAYVPAITQDATGNPVHVDGT